MRLIPRDQIVVPEDRQRKHYDPKKLHDLEVDILSAKGLLHPPCVYVKDGKYVLLTGGRRMKAMDALRAKAKKGDIPEAVISCDGRWFNLDVHYPVSLVGKELGCDLTPSELFEAELHENTHREDLTWAEKCEALATLHKLRLAENPDQTKRDTAREIIESGMKKGTLTPEGKATRGSSNELARRIHEAVLVSENMHDPKIAAARNQSEAYALVVKQQEEAAIAELAKRRMVKNASTPIRSLVEVRHGDALTILPQLEAGTVDLILTDPPYGMEAGAGGFRSRAVHHHNYDDTPDTFREIAKAILTEGFRVAKQRANLFMFFHIREYNWLDNAASNMGWSTFPVPLLWIKSDSEGIRPWGAQGPARTYDAILFATKGQRGLNAPITDNLRFNRVGRNDRLHAAEKPLDLLKHLIEASTMVGDTVLDPCAGSGSTIKAAKLTQRKAIGIEKDEAYYSTAMANVFGDDVV